MAQPTKRVAREIFGHLPDGTAIEMVRLFGDNGFEARIIGYGAALQSLLVPDRAGRLGDVVLGRDDLEGYLAVRRFLGATVGRYANRIAGGRFELDGEHFQLPANDGVNALHGGFNGFDRKPWTVVALGEQPAPFVTLSYVSADGEEGYPGKLATEITYSIPSGMELSIAFSAVTDRPTVVNLTNHSFFNLAGVEAGVDILDHRLAIAADDYLPVTPDGIPLAAHRHRSRQRRSISAKCIASARVSAMPTSSFGSGRATTTISACAAASSANRGWRRGSKIRGPAAPWNCWTDQPGVQFYSGNFLDGSVIGKYGRAHRQFDALCLEPQRLSGYAEPSGLSVGAARSRTNLSSRLALPIFRRLRGTAMEDRIEEVAHHGPDDRHCHLGEGPSYDAATDTAWWFDILDRTFVAGRSRDR